MEFLGELNSHNESDKLKEVFDGNAAGILATLTWLKKEEISRKILIEAKKFAKKNV